MTTSSIRPGWHFGTAARHGRVGRFLLTETRYPAGLRTPVGHAHQTPAFCLVLRGRYVQRFRRPGQIVCTQAGEPFYFGRRRRSIPITSRPTGPPASSSNQTKHGSLKPGLDRLNTPSTGSSTTPAHGRDGSSSTPSSNPGARMR